MLSTNINSIKTKIPQQKSKLFNYTFKIVMIGDSGVGKSCILLRFTDDKFNNNFIPTIGVDFRSKNIKIDNKIIKFQIVRINKYYFFISGMHPVKKDLYL